MWAEGREIVQEMWPLPCVWQARSITCGSHALLELIPACRAKEKPWATLDVAPNLPPYIPPQKKKKEEKKFGNLTAPNSCSCPRTALGSASSEPEEMELQFWLKHGSHHGSRNPKMSRLQCGSGEDVRVFCSLLYLNLNFLLLWFTNISKIISRHPVFQH